MALMIRLRKQGRTNRQTFRLVVTDARAPRDGKYLEKLGYSLPCEDKNSFFVDRDRVAFWIAQGAKLTENAEKFIGKAAPDVVKALHEQEHAKRVKACAKRRAARKKKGVAVVPSASSEKKVAPPKRAKKAPVKVKKVEASPAEPAEEKA